MIALGKVRKVSNKSDTQSQTLLCLFGCNDTFPRPMLLSLKLVIGRHEPNHLARELPLGVTRKHMANVIECNRETKRTLKNNLNKRLTTYK